VNGTWASESNGWEKIKILMVTTREEKVPAWRMTKAWIDHKYLADSILSICRYQYLI
jgi:hypothetical protein